MSIRPQTFRVKTLGTPGLALVESQLMMDERGHFSRIYDEQLFKEANRNTRWIQESISHSIREGTVRGLHYQKPPYAETKLVRVLRGHVFFVVVDLRCESPAFGKWESLELSEQRSEALYVPKGCAMGMCTLTEKCTLLYKMDTSYVPESQAIIKWNDPQLAINWPVRENVIISPRDREAPGFMQFLSEQGCLNIDKEWF